MKMGDFVVVVNADKVKATGKKEEDKNTGTILVSLTKRIEFKTSKIKLPRKNN